MLQTKQILKVLYVMIIREYDYRYVMKYLLRPDLCFSRAVDVPSALSIVKEHRREYMPCDTVTCK